MSSAAHIHSWQRSGKSVVLATVQGLLCCLAAATPAFSQITDTAITVGPETFPRYAAVTDSKLIIRPGETYTFPELTEVSAIEISGTALVSRDHDTRIICDNLTILPGGTLDVGRCEDPVLRNVSIEFRGEPLRADDPEQMGRGLQNLGTLFMHGAIKAPFSKAAEMRAGATTIELTDEPVGWLPGDELLIPDTKQMIYGGRNSNRFDHEPVATIAAVDGKTVTLTKPLTFDHLGARSPGGELRFLPYVANATRNIVLRSQSTAAKAHLVHLHDAMVDCRYFTCLDMGRTTTEPLDRVTNRAGRYAFHLHHVNQHRPHRVDADHPHAGHIIGAVIRGASRWGIVIHQTHDFEVTDNVCDMNIGAGIVTEDGNERRNIIRRNFVMRSLGNGKSAIQQRALGTLGGEGAGFWFHGSENIVEDNIACNNFIGFNWFHLDQPKLKAPAYPGGPLEEFQSNLSVPIATGYNIAASNMMSGHETWRIPGTKQWHLDGAIAYHNGLAQIFVGNGQISSVIFNNVDLLASGGVTKGISTSFGYTLKLTVDGGRIEGCESGLIDVSQKLTARNLVLRNKKNINWQGLRGIGPVTLLENLVSEPLPGGVHLAGPLRPPGVKNNRTVWNQNVGVLRWVRNWQGEQGNDFALYFPSQVADQMALTATTPGNLGGLPEEGLTLAEGWKKYGMAFGGGICWNPETLPGFERMLLDRSPELRLGTPRAVLVFPNRNADPSKYADSKGLRGELVLTGEPADGLAVVVDGVQLSRIQSVRRDVYLPRLPATAGRHEVRTWRTRSGRMIPASEMRFEYFVGVPVPDTEDSLVTAEPTSSSSANVPPVLQPIADHSLTRGSTLTLPLEATDHEGQSLTYSATADNAVVSVSGADLKVVPAATFIGTIDVTVTVSDGIDSHSDSFLIAVDGPPPTEVEILRERVAQLEAELAALRQQLGSLVAVPQ